MMDIDEYQKKVATFATYPGRGKLAGDMYLALGLNGEAGEVAEKFKKGYHKGLLVVPGLAEELGDVLWYLAELASSYGYNLSEIAEINIRKLESRKERDVIIGEGDDR